MARSITTVSCSNEGSTGWSPTVDSCGAAASATVDPSAAPSLASHPPLQSCLSAGSSPGVLVNPKPIAGHSGEQHDKRRSRRSLMSISARRLAFPFRRPPDTAGGIRALRSENVVVELGLFAGRQGNARTSALCVCVLAKVATDSVCVCEGACVCLCLCAPLSRPAVLPRLFQGHLLRLSSRGSPPEALLPRLSS